VRCLRLNLKFHFFVQRLQEVFGALLLLFFGIHFLLQLPVHQVMANVVAYDDNKQFIMEIDLVVVNNEVLVAVECKSHLSNDDVNEHLDRLALFKHCFPQYKDYRILGAVAGMVVPTEVGRHAYRKGLFVLAQSGDTVEIRNGEGFRPKEW
jgi:hypothetical protein